MDNRPSRTKVEARHVARAASQSFPISTLTDLSAPRYLRQARELVAALEALQAVIDSERVRPAVPVDFPVKVLTDDEWQTAKDPCKCLECGRRWDDAVPTTCTPAPSARCPFEYYH